MNKYKRLGKNTVWVFIGNAGGKLIGLVMLPFYTGWLSVEDYGMTDMISVYVSFLVSLVSCCIAESVFIFPKGQEAGKQKQYFSSGIAFVLLSFSLSVLLFGIADAVSSAYGFSDSFTRHIWLIYGLMAATILQQFFQQFTRSIDKMIVYGMAGIILTLLTVLCSFALVPLMGVSGYVLSLILANLLTGLYSFLFSGGYKYCSLGSVSVERCREMLQYSIPLIPNGVMWWLVGALNRPVMEVYVGLRGIGLFAVANKFPGIITMIFTIFATSWQISVLEEYGKKGYEEFYNRIFRGVVLMLLALLVMVTLTSKWLVQFFASPDYRTAWIYIPILTLGTLFSSVSGLAGSTFSAVRKSKYFFYSSVYGGITSIVFNFLLIPIWGIWGAAFSVVLSFIAMSVSRIAYSWRYVRLTHLSRLLLMLLLTCVYIASVCLTDSINNVLTGFITIIALFLLNRDLLYSLKDKIIKNYKMR